MPSEAYVQLMQGEFGAALVTAMSKVLPLGLAWIFIGALIFAVIQTKTKHYGISGSVFILYCSLTIGFNLIDIAIQPFIGLLIGIMLAVMIIQLVIK